MSRVCLLISQFTQKPLKWQTRTSYDHNRDLPNYKYNLLFKEETIEKNFDNDLLQDKVEKINKIVSEEDSTSPPRWL